MPEKKGKTKKADKSVVEPAVVYKALVGLTNDRTGRRYEAGEKITEGDFGADVLLHWLETGKVVVT